MVAIEPHPVTHARLAFNNAASGYTQVRLVAAAAGASDGELMIETDGDNLGASHIVTGKASRRAIGVRSLRLQRTTASIHPTSAGEGCRAEWFHIKSNTVPTDPDVAPGYAVHGSLVLRFDDAPGSQDACKSVDLQVVVTAR